MGILLLELVEQVLVVVLHVERLIVETRWVIYEFWMLLIEQGECYGFKSRENCLQV